VYAFVKMKAKKKARWAKYVLGTRETVSVLPGIIEQLSAPIRGVLFLKKFKKKLSVLTYIPVTNGTILLIFLTKSTSSINITPIRIVIPKTPKPNIESKRAPIFLSIVVDYLLCTMRENTRENILYQQEEIVEIRY